MGIILYNSFMIYIAFILFTLLIVTFVIYQWQYFLVFTPTFYREENLCTQCTLLEIESFDGVKLEGVLYKPSSPNATLLFFAGRSHDVVGLINKLAHAYPNTRIVSFNYRAYGKSQGKITETNLHKDALVITDIVQKNYGEFCVMGFSLGSSLASYVASKREVKALFLVGAFDSIDNLMPKKWLRPFARYRFSSYKHVSNVSASTHLFISKNDEIIPLQNAHNLKKHIKNLLYFKEFEHLTHKEILWDAEVIQTINKELL